VVFANPYGSVVPSSMHRTVVTVWDLWDPPQTDSDRKSTFFVRLGRCPNRGEARCLQQNDRRAAAGQGLRLPKAGWIKQHLRIKAFYGIGENAVKTQIWIAVSVYVLVAIIRKRLMLPISLYRILQILSVILFEKTPILQALQPSDSFENFPR